MVILWFGFTKEQLYSILGWRKFSCVASQHGSKDLEAPHRYLHQILWFAAPAHILHLQARDASVYKVSGIFTYFLYLIIFGRAWWSLFDFSPHFPEAPNNFYIKEITRIWSIPAVLEQVHLSVPNYFMQYWLWHVGWYNKYLHLTDEEAGGQNGLSICPCLLDGQARLRRSPFLPFTFWRQKGVQWDFCLAASLHPFYSL